MSRWFRHYAGMCRDEKLVGVAIRAKQPIERIVWIYAAILESAAEIDDGGRFDLDTAEAAYFLRTDEADVQLVLDLLERAGRLSSDRVAKWGDRQFQSDKSAERQKRYREKRKGSSGDSCDSDDRVTSPSRHRDAPETETDTDTDTDTEIAADAAIAPARKVFEGLEAECRKLVNEEPVLLALDWYVIENLLAEGCLPVDVRAGISAAMAKPNFRIRHWSQVAGWVRRAAQDRIAGAGKAVGQASYKSPVVDKGAGREWAPEGSERYSRWQTFRPGYVSGIREERRINGALQWGALLPVGLPPREQEGEAA